MAKENKLKLGKALFDAHKSGNTEKKKSILSKMGGDNVAASIYKRTLCDNLLAAATKGDLAEMQSLIDKGADVNYATSSYIFLDADKDSASTIKVNRTIIEIASVNHQFGAVKLLINNNAKIDNEYLPPENSPLIQATMAKSFETVKFLLEAKANPNYGEKTTPLHEASEEVQVDMVKLLSEYKTNPLEKNSNENTQLESLVLSVEWRLGFHKYLSDTLKSKFQDCTLVESTLQEAMDDFNYEGVSTEMSGLALNTEQN